MTDLILILLYAVPIARISLFFVPPLDVSFLRAINSYIGRVEWILHPLRDSALLAYLLFLVANGIYFNKIMPGILFLPFVALSLFAWIRYGLHKRRVAEFALNNPFIHPKDFFGCYYSGFGPLPTKLPRVAKRTIDPSNSDFTNGAKATKSCLPVIVGAANTFTIARLILAAFNWKGSEYARSVARSLSTIWGARAAYLTRSKVCADGPQKLNGLNGKFIFAFNHRSYLDFAFGTFALPQRFAFRYLAAKDHFLDNPFYYFLMGKALQIIGTIFVDRRNKSSGAVSSAYEAAAKLATLDTNIAIFPQGTRAYGNVAANGRRLDSGYYTSGNRERLFRSGGHLKKGAAYIAVDAAIALRNVEQSYVHIVPISIEGTGIAAPRGSLKVQVGTTIKIKVGDPITIKNSDVKGLNVGASEYASFVENIHIRLDGHFKTLLDTHATLEQRFFRDIRAILPSTDYEHVSVAMRAWRGVDYLIYTILDCIYATKPSNWQNFLREISFLLISDSPLPTFLHFKERVVDHMLEGK